ncbi:MAG TPA: hypothetical protein VML91_15780, partial [Burkholderiales bacterium]|nr:hypothetical protein [Burkholderiales bacterium]
MDNADLAGRGAARRGPLHFLAACGIVVALAGCATEVQRQTQELRRESGRIPTIVVMPLDVELSQLTAGGMQEPHAEWTETAHKHMRAALEGAAKSYKVRLVEFQPEHGTPEDRETSLDLVRLHRAVGSAVLLHQYLGLTLPSKEGKFDWGLGPSVAAISRSHEADYALFLFVRDSYATAGRVAVIVVAALLGVGMPGGTQIGFASVVDLKTGDIVWFNRLLRPQGDLRTPEAAAETVRA